jgi:RNA polymerase sigma factor (sigma-70 family)
MAAETLSDRPDRELIQRFLARRDEALFEVLVRRHGPMVYRVCWRVLHHGQDDEDAFQATFLVLAQKLRSVRQRDSLASWLQGVAHRVALKVKDQAATRRRHERRVAVTEAVPPDEVAWEELHTALDAELTRLPDRLRLPLILCYLEGRTQDEAASQLGWSKSTLLRRLQEARAALGRRLARRGVVWPAALSAVLLSDCVESAALPPGLLGSTVEAAACDAAGKAAAAGVIPAKVVALTEGVLNAMFLTRLRMVAAVLVAATLACCSAGLLAHTIAGPQTELAKTAAARRGKSQPAISPADPRGKPAGAPDLSKVDRTIKKEPPTGPSPSTACWSSGRRPKSASGSCRTATPSTWTGTATAT